MYAENRETYCAVCDKCSKISELVSKPEIHDGNMFDVLACPYCGNSDLEPSEPVEKNHFAGKTIGQCLAEIDEEIEVEDYFDIAKNGMFLFSGLK